MNKILIVVLIVSLFFIEGCTGLGYTTGKGNNIKKELELEKMESIEENSRLTISMKNDEVIKGQFISCINDTLFVTFQADKNLNSPISNNQFLSISHNKAVYKIPVDQIEGIKVNEADFKIVGILLGIVFVVFILGLISLQKSDIPG